VRPERDPDLPWVRYRYITSDRMRVLTGRNHVEMTCAICGIRELRVLRIPRFGPVPEPPGGQHIARVEFKLAHLHPEQPAQVMWAQPFGEEQLQLPDAARLEAIEIELRQIQLVHEIEEWLN
jgi:hypothetical protein